MHQEERFFFGKANALQSSSLLARLARRRDEDAALLQNAGHGPHASRSPAAPPAPPRRAALRQHPLVEAGKPAPPDRGLPWARPPTSGQLLQKLLVPLGTPSSPRWPQGRQVAHTLRAQWAAAHPRDMPCSLETQSQKGLSSRAALRVPTTQHWPCCMQRAKNSL